jgi:hypothetical protein
VEGTDSEVSDVISTELSVVEMGLLTLGGCSIIKLTSKLKVPLPKHWLLSSEKYSYYIVGMST